MGKSIDILAVGYFAVAVAGAIEGAWDRRERRRLEAERDARDRRIAALEARVRELESQTKGKAAQEVPHAT